jgi:small subunit ribosomal protein S8
MSTQSTDPVADMLTRIRNAINVGRNEIRLPLSKLKLVIAQELVKAKYLHSVKTVKASPRDEMVITLAPDNDNPAITGLARISKPGRRVYAKAGEIPKVKSGRGIVLVSTSQGVMTGGDATKKRLGGELICKVY